MARQQKGRNGIRGRLQNAAHSVRDRLEDVRDRADDYVKHHPLPSLAIAAGVGAAIGIGIGALLFKSRPRSFWDRFFD